MCWPDFPALEGLSQPERVRRIDENRRLISGAPKETAEKRFKRICRELHAQGVYPSPTVLNWWVHGRRSRHLGGKQPQWRREVFAELGISLQRPPRPREGVILHGPSPIVSFDEQYGRESAVVENMEVGEYGVDPASGKDRTAIIFIHGGNQPPPGWYYTDGYAKEPEPPRIVPPGPRRIKA